MSLAWKKKPSSNERENCRVGWPDWEVFFIWILFKWVKFLHETGVTRSKFHLVKTKWEWATNDEYIRINNTHIHSKTSLQYTNFRIFDFLLLIIYDYVCTFFFCERQADILCCACPNEKNIIICKATNRLLQIIMESIIDVGEWYSHRIRIIGYNIYRFRINATVASACL